jgi:hypothetical protein
VPPIPKAGREKRTMGGAGPKLKANRLYPSSRAGDHQTSASPASGWSSSPNEVVRISHFPLSIMLTNT